MMTPEKKLDALFRFIYNYKAAHDGNSPTLREIKASEDAPYKSASHISDALRKLEERGLIRLGPKGATRSIEVVGARWTPPPSHLACVIPVGEKIKRNEERMRALERVAEAVRSFWRATGYKIRSEGNEFMKAGDLIVRRHETGEEWFDADSEIAEAARLLCTALEEVR